MGKASATRKGRPKKAVEVEVEVDVDFVDDTSTAVAESSPAAAPAPAPAEEGGQSRKRKASNRSKPNFEIDEKEGVGLCVLLNEEWLPAIWHHKVVLGLDKEKYGVHLYNVEPPRKNDTQPSEDVTTFLAGQKRWNLVSKQDRPDILFQLYPNVDQFPNRYEPVKWLETEIDGVNKIVVDIVTRRPLRDFENIPFQLATNAEGGRLEAMNRQDSRIMCEDFLQRMIPLLNEHGDPLRDDKGIIRSDRLLRNALNNVKTQFRNKHRCLSWNSHTHDSMFDKRLLKDITKEDKAANTTRNLSEFSSSELTEIRSLVKCRPSNLTDANEIDSTDTAIKNESGPDAPQNTGKEPVTKEQSSGATTDLVEDGNAQPPSQVFGDQVSTRAVTKRRHRRREYTKKSEREYVPAPSPSSAESSQPSTEDTGKVDSPPIDPALFALSTLPPLAGNTVQNSSKSIDSTLTAQDAPSQSTEDKVRMGSLSNDATLLTGDASTRFAEDTVPKGSWSTDPAPATFTAAASATATEPQEFLKRNESSGQPSNVMQIERPVETTQEQKEDHIGEDRPTLKRKFVDDHGGEVLSSDSTQLDHSQHEAESPPKRPRILPPTHDAQGLLEIFNGTSRPGIPSTSSESVHRSAFSNTATQFLQRRSASPRPNIHREIAPRLPYTAPLIRPLPYSPAPPSPLAQPSAHPQILQAEQSHFAYVTSQISDLSLLKTRLLTAWTEAQVSTADGSSLYGPKLAISLSALGPTSTARTDTEVRALMSAYNIPAHWSASSIDLRQHPYLRHAVHQAMCEAERWDVRNYHPNDDNRGGSLNHDEEGGFYLATAQWHAIDEGSDSRFSVFQSTASLNASLHHAFWRFKQLTGRDFAAHNSAAAFQAVGCSYHDAWCEIRRQVFLPYFLRFGNPVEALAWMPALGVLEKWGGGLAERWERSRSHVEDRFGSRFDRDMVRAMDPRLGGSGAGLAAGEGEKVSLPLQSVDLEGIARGMVLS